MVRFRVRVAFRLGLGLESPLNTNREYVCARMCVCVCVCVCFIVLLFILLYRPD